MSTIQLIIVCLTVVVLSAAFTLAIAMRNAPRMEDTPRSDGSWGLSVGDYVVLYVSEGQSVRGIVIDSDEHAVTLERAEIITRDEPVSIGKCRVANEQVALVQYLTPSAEKATA